MSIKIFHFPIIRLSACALCIFFLSHGTVYAQQGLQMGRIKLSSKLKVETQYSDNIFRNNQNSKNEVIYTVVPQFFLDFAFVPGNTLTAQYKGDFRHYRHFDNFAKTHNFGKIQWQRLQPRGSRIELGSSIDDSSIQPYSEISQSKHYLEWQAYLDTLIKIGSLTESGLRLEVKSREFDDDLWSMDNYDRYGLSYHVAYRKFPFTSFIGEYNFYHQDNDNVDGIFTDIDVHSVLFGPRWEPRGRLSGKLLGGYSWISLDNSTDSSGFSFNADLTYRFSGFTTFRLSAYRSYSSSTRADRETNIYNVSTGATFAADYSRWKPFRFFAVLNFKNQEFEGDDVVFGKRTDNYYQAELRSNYSILKWLLLELKYQYKKKESKLNSVEYEENLAMMNFIFSL